LFRSVDALLRPKTVALIGASESGGAGWGKAIYENFRYAGWPARMFLVNPKRDELWGERVYPDLGAVPEPVDLALVIIPSPFIPATLEEAAQHGLRCALLYAARMGEDGDPEGIARAEAVKALCARTGMRVSGPNCMGSISLRERMLLYPSARVRPLPAGKLGVVFQSGGTFQFWLQQAAVRGLGFSYAISSGNEIDLDLADYINALLDDDGTRMVACMVEGVRRPDALMAVAAKAMRLGKPLMLVKIGRSKAGEAAARSHTGALAGDDAVFDAMCRQYGVIRCASLDDMIETALAFSLERVPSGKRVGMVIASGGAKGLFLDHGAEAGIGFGKPTQETVAKLASLIDQGVPAENPLDTGAGLATSPLKLAECARVMVADPNIDVLAMHAMLPLEGETADPAWYGSVLTSTDKPVIAFSRMAQNVGETGRAVQAACGVPFLQGMPEATRALRCLVEYGAALRRGVPEVMPAPAVRPALDDAALQARLAAAGVALPRSRVVADVEAAVAAAGELGFPVVLKLISPEALHKTEVGGVAVGLRDADAVRRAATEMQGRVSQVDGFLLQEMVSGLEVIAGLREDVQYGPYLLLGLGGVMVEALGDVALSLLPVSEATVLEMLDGLRGAALFGTFRGQKPRDVAALARNVVALSQVFLEERGWISDLEVNPIMVGPEDAGEGGGVRAVDVRVIRR
jgi:acetate---CoA ligase (ADP-forming)